MPTAIMRVPLSRGMQATAERFADEHAKIRKLEGQLRGARQRRRLLAVKLRTGGMTTRGVGDIVGVSGVHVIQWCREYEGERPASEADRNAMEPAA